MDRFAVLTGSITLSNGSGSASINYPDGFTKNNCVPVSHGTTYTSSGWIAFGVVQGGATLTGVRLMDNGITFYTSSPGGSGPSGTYQYKVVLMKVD